MNLFSLTSHRFVDISLGREFFAALILVTATTIAPAQQTSADARGPAATNITASTLSPSQVDAIIRAFTSKETQFRQALNTYAFKRDALVQTIGMGGQVTGEYHRVSLFTFNDQVECFSQHILRCK